MDLLRAGRAAPVPAAAEGAMDEPAAEGDSKVKEGELKVMLRTGRSRRAVARRAWSAEGDEARWGVAAAAVLA